MANDSGINDALSNELGTRKSPSFAGGGRDRTRTFDKGSSGSFDRKVPPQRNGDRAPASPYGRSARLGKDDSEDVTSSQRKKSRFDNEGVRAYGDATGFFSKGSRSRRPGDRPVTTFDDRSARPAREPVKSYGSDPRPPRNEERASTRSFDRSSYPPRDGNRESAERNPRSFKNESSQRDNVPVAIPYSSAASQWLYGVNTVIAALRGKRRKIYQAIVKKGERSSEMDQIMGLARTAGINISTHDDTRLLDKLSDGRPHNGAVLEVSTLPVQPAIQLGRPDAKTSKIPLELQRQTAEEIAVNGRSSTVQYDSKLWRKPIILFLDGITDPGNVGGILRTAHFYGVEAVAIATNTCCNLNSPILAKASAGACEAIPILAVSKPADFISMSSKAGWNICAAVAPDARSRKQLTTTSVASQSPLAKKPCILMMGSEGEGLRKNLLAKADLEVTIQRGTSGQNSVDVGVDSMNVGVATGVLVDAFMREPSARMPAAASDSSNSVF